MILTLAHRTLRVHPVRSAVLAGGFGLGVAVMAILLGVGEVVLEQARSPALAGGGDLVFGGAAGSISSARYVLSGVLSAPPLARQIVAASPSVRAPLYLLRGSRVVTLRARGGIPSLERLVGDPETAAIAAWTDTAADAAWATPDAGEVLRAMDRFHAVPDVPAWRDSWAEWLYFNGRAGATRFYLTFLVGPPTEAGRRAGGVRLQLDRGGQMASFGESAELDAEAVLRDAPDLTIGVNRVRLEGTRYRVTVDLPRLDPDPPPREASRARVDLTLDARPGQSLPPLTIRGAQGWVSGYTVPVMSGALGGRIDVDGTPIPLAGGTGYHDHNWGFWRGVRWQWGQVQHGDLALLYGRISPPPEVADAERMPGFLGVLGPAGPLGFATDVAIEEVDDAETQRPRRISVRGQGEGLDVTVELAVTSAIETRMDRGLGGARNLLQLRADYHVTGTAGGRALEFTAPGAAETFRGR